MDVFTRCHRINELMEQGNADDARNELIRLLDFLKKSALEYSPLINNLIRRSGLFPYLDESTASWQDRLVTEAFKVDVGGHKKIALHREQSFLLNKLLTGKSVAVTAPTSFGKSFVIDSYIALRKPENVAIIVPTIALTDETRRRLQQKFGKSYKIITTADEELAEKNIFIFPQERASQYAKKLETLDILVIDEFYKASVAFDRERSPALLKVMLDLGKLAKQKYFLAPNISDINDNVFTRGMEICKLDFNTVFLDKVELYEEIGSDQEKKSDALLSILSNKGEKTLIYAGTYSNVNSVATLLIADGDSSSSPRLNSFSRWLSKHYDPNWTLTKLVRKGAGIHTGQLHRAISQIQIRMFEEEGGLDQLLSTSSIIEGVNTSAQNVVLWSNLSGRSKGVISDFSYKNIIGRGGRMLRHFVGKVYVLERPPNPGDTPLDLDIPDELLPMVEHEEEIKADLTAEQLAKIIAYKEELAAVVSQDQISIITDGKTLVTSDTSIIKAMVIELQGSPSFWHGIGFLNSSDPDEWESILYRVIQLQSGGWNTRHRSIVQFIKVLSGNWQYTIPELLTQLQGFDIGLDDFFKLERLITHRLPTLLGDLSTVQNKILASNSADISSFISKISHAFLPRVVHQLEEYGLPRCLTRKIQHSGLIDFEDASLDIYKAIDLLVHHRLDLMDSPLYVYDTFDQYIFDYFFSGVQAEIEVA
ncbi:TPA: hypothetical protein QEM96_000852 [Pseudomonas putida]|nr:hypothetical protein [Pseudomonas putida]